MLMYWVLLANPALDRHPALLVTEPSRIIPALLASGR